MSDRLTSADVAFLYLEGRTTPQHVGGIAVFEAPGGFDYDRLVRLLQERISLVPRYRQRLRAVPASLANPVWVDDPNFDLTYHVRRSALPRPGGEAALLEFCARIQSRLLDRDRPLWEMYLVEGLADDRVAVITKTHPSMVDGRRGVDIAEVLLDESPEPRRTVEALWMPAPEPSPLQLTTDAVTSALRRPAAVVDAVRLARRDAGSAVRRWTGAVSGIGGVVAGAVAGAVTGVVAESVSARIAHAGRAPRTSPLRTELGQHRRLAVERARLADFRTVRGRCGGTVNDVVIAVVAGALRNWLLSRGELLAPTDAVRALVPVSLQDGDDDVAGEARPVVGLLVDLPVGEADPLRRLAAVQVSTAEALAADHPVGADALVGLSGFAPPTLYSLGARAAGGLTRRMYSVAITNVPGPQQARYAAGARLAELFPVLPLNKGQSLAIAVTSYDGGMYFCVNADRDAVPDIEQIAGWLGSVLGDLLTVSAPADITPARRRRRDS